MKRSTYAGMIAPTDDNMQNHASIDYPILRDGTKVSADGRVAVMIVNETLFVSSYFNGRETLYSVAMRELD